MAKLVIENLTPLQARCLAKWYESYGEQEAEIWFDGLDYLDCPAPKADVGHSQGFTTELRNGDVILWCR